MLINQNNKRLVAIAWKFFLCWTTKQNIFFYLLTLKEKPLRKFQPMSLWISETDWIYNTRDRYICIGRAACNISTFGRFPVPRLETRILSLLSSATWSRSSWYSLRSVLANFIKSESSIPSLSVSDNAWIAGWIFVTFHTRNCGHYPRLLRWFLGWKGFKTTGTSGSETCPGFLSKECFDSVLYSVFIQTSPPRYLRLIKWIEQRWNCVFRTTTGIQISHAARR